MIVHHPPSFGGADPNRCEPTRSVGTSATGKNVLASYYRLIRSNRPDLQVIITQRLGWSPGAPESGSHLTLDSSHAAHQSGGAHRRRRVDVGGEIHRKLAAIPAGRRGIERRSDRVCI